MPVQSVNANGAINGSDFGQTISANGHGANGHATNGHQNDYHTNGHAAPSTSTAGPSSSRQPRPSASASRPNILFVMADQLAAPQLRMYNEKSQILTPNLDRLAQDSVVLDSAYCNSPLCAPSRMALVTGQLPSKIGSYDNASSISSDLPTYAHYLRSAGYETVLAGKMHFIGDQLHGFEKRLTADIYPGDYGWAVNWDEPDRRLEWYHNASSILQAGPCVRSNQMDYDEEVLYKSKQYLFDHARRQGGDSSRPFALTVSFTHPHDPYTIEEEFWNLYEGVDINMPEVEIHPDSQDPHSKRLRHVCDLEGRKFTPEQIKRAKRAYYGSVSYVDAKIGELLSTLDKCGLRDNTIIVFSGDHGDMLGERSLWYKMSYFESSVRVPLLFNYPKMFAPRRVKANVSTMDLLPTFCDIVGIPLYPQLPLDGISMLPHLLGQTGHDTVIAEYMGEGTVAPLFMIRRGPWKYITCPADPPQLFNLARDPKELVNLAAADRDSLDAETRKALEGFEIETLQRWDAAKITEDVLLVQRRRRFVFSSLKQGAWTSWDYQVPTDTQNMYIRSHLDLDELERMARFPPVDEFGNLITAPSNSATQLNGKLLLHA
ncbi:probable choline-sulfatase [Sporisorium reilianum f. sp. reilianum]|uniref:Probable choline-sulfatase n=1 Tax=Sporisorium reilianum f. sp. reilianum TaxID=72559 RepID=A0A2N8UJB1_9BASI|nr:probable choline-sulfatase [Sporisorium reilianum f. sp. reilianum]